MTRALAFALLAALLAAGCMAKNQDPADGEPTDADLAAAAANMSAASQMAQNMSAQGNATAANGTAAKDPNMPDDPSACMQGMDMPGCTAGQSDYYYKQQMKSYVPPPPDKELPKISIKLDPQGANPSGAFKVDNGTKQLLVDVYLNDTGPGPYASLGPGGQGDLKLTFKGATDSKAIPLGSSGGSVGADPANPLARSWHTSIELPAEGDWKVTLEGQGTNAELTVHLVERFYS